MNLFSPDPFWGIFLFFAGVVILNICSSVERENHRKMQSLRTLAWYGRRKMDTFATLPFNIRGSFLCLGGGALSLYGLILLVQSINWMDF